MFSSVAGPAPLTSPKALIALNGPLASRYAMAARAMAGPVPTGACRATIPGAQMSVRWASLAPSTGPRMPPARPRILLSRDALAQTAILQDLATASAPSLSIEALGHLQNCPVALCPHRFPSLIAHKARPVLLSVARVKSRRPTEPGTRETFAHRSTPTDGLLAPPFRCRSRGAGAGGRLTVERCPTVACTAAARPPRPQRLH